MIFFIAKPASTNTNCGCDYALDHPQVLSLCTKTILNTAGLDKGIYLLRVVSVNGALYSGKVVKN